MLFFLEISVRCEEALGSDALIEAIPLEFPSQLIDVELELLLDLHSLLLCLQRTIGAADLSLCIACKWD
jgi:hypothetical protein